MKFKFFIFVFFILFLIESTVYCNSLKIIDGSKINTSFNSYRIYPNSCKVCDSACSRHCSVADSGFDVCYNWCVRGCIRALIFSV